MNKKLSILLALLALVLATLACAAGELSLENPRMSKDDTGNNPVTSFSPGDTFYVVADLNNATNGTTIEARWYTVDVPGYESGQIPTDTPSQLTISEDYFTGTVNFSLTGGGDPWPTGSYKVELYLNGVLTHTVNFTVQ